MGKTAFVQEACETVSVLGAHYKPPVDLQPQKELQDLFQYYKRPRIISVGNITLGTRLPLFLNQLNPNEIWTLASGDSRRIRGAYGARFTLVFTLELNATPFTQGLAALSFQYDDGSSIIRNVSCQATNLPHVRLDPTVSSMCTLRVPFMSNDDFRCITDTDPYGYVMLHTILPFDNDGSVNPTWKLFMHIEDIQLFGVLPTEQSTLIPPAQMLVSEPIDVPVQKATAAASTSRGVVSPFAPAPRLARTSSLIRTPPAASILDAVDGAATAVGLIRDATHAMVGDSQYTPKIAFQSGLGGPVTGEFETETHPFSSGVHAASRVLHWLARGVPSISSIAGPTSWALGKAAGVIRYFGFSKPTITDPPQRVFATTSVLEHNVDVATNSLMLAPLSDNRLAVSTTFTNSDVDEMSIPYILSQYNQVCVGVLKTTDSYGSKVYGTCVSPQTLFFRAYTSAPALNLKYDTTAAPNVAPSGIAWLGNMFKYWRGGMRFRFTFAKTKFHAGRVALTFIPTTNPYDFTIATPGFDAFSLFQYDGHTMICDLKDSNVFDFEIPYSVPYAFLPNGAQSGSLTMTVVDPLQASGAVVASQVSFLVEVCAAPDFEFAFPTGIRFAAADVTPDFQSGLVKDSTNTKVCENTMGECITSVKQLVMIPHQALFLYGGKNDTVDIAPWYYHPSSANTFEATSYGGNIARAYCFVRGGSEYHFYAAANSTSAEFRAYMRDADYPVASPTVPVDSSPLVISTNNNLHFRAPSYQPHLRMFPRRFNDFNPTWNLNYNNTTDDFPNAYFTTATVALKASSVPAVYPRVAMIGTGTSQLVYTFKRHAADDAMCCTYIGPPAVKYTLLGDYPPYSRVP